MSKKKEDKNKSIIFKKVDFNKIFLDGIETFKDIKISPFPKEILGEWINPMFFKNSPERNQLAKKLWNKRKLKQKLRRIK